MARGLSTQQLARSNPVRSFLADVLRDEARLGRIKQDADGKWRAVPDLVAEYGSAFAYVQSPNYVGTRRTEET